MTRTAGLEEAILLRLIDRLVLVEQQTAINLVTVCNVTEAIDDMRRSIANLLAELDELRDLSMAATRNLEQMRNPVQGLLNLKEKISGGWLVMMAIVVASGYLLQPLIEQMYRWRLGLK